MEDRKTEIEKKDPVCVVLVYEGQKESTGIGFHGGPIPYRVWYRKSAAFPPGRNI